MYLSRRISILIFTYIALAFNAHAKKTPPALYNEIIVSQINSIYDGDTFRVDIAGYPAVIGNNIPIRINGVDTPEIRGKCDSEKLLARQAKQFTVNALRNAKRVELKNIQRGKYFRLVADVYVDGVNLGNSLLKQKLAYEYHAGTKKSWCN